MKKLIRSLLLLTLVLTVPAVAETITGINYIDGVTIMPGGPGVGFSGSWANETGWYPIGAIDGSGLDTATGTHATTVSGNGWLSGGDPAWVKFDLGATYNLKGVRIWSYNNPDVPARQLGGVNFYVTSDPNTGWGTPHAVTLNSFTPSTTMDISQTRVLNAAGRYVRMDVTSTYGSTPALSEIRFTETEPNIPAGPQTWDLASSLSETDNPFGVDDVFSIHNAADDQLLVVTSSVFWNPWFGPGWGIVGQQFPSCLLPSDRGNHGEGPYEMMIQPAGGFLARWTSPVQGWVDVDFYHGQGGWNQTSQSGFYAYQNDALISNAYIPWPVSSYLWPAYKNTLENGCDALVGTRYVEIGDTLDFVVVTDGVSGDGGNGPVSTALHLTISTLETDPNSVVLTVNESSPAGAPVAPAVGLHTVVEGGKVLLTAADEYFNGTSLYLFDHWVGAVDNTASPETFIVMDANKAVQAVYAVAPTSDLTITASPSQVTTVVPAPGVHTYATGTVVDLSASDYISCPEVYSFDYWVGAVADPFSATTTITLNANAAVEAVFADNRACGDTCHPIAATDLNADCIINLTDLTVLAADWLDCTQPACD